jgi:hypothetical protein
MSICFELFFISKINSGCRPITVISDVEFNPDCSFLVDTEAHPEYQDLELLGKNVLLWFGYAYSGYVQDQVKKQCGKHLSLCFFLFELEGAVNWYEGLSAERQNQTAVVFVNSYLYADFIGSLEEKIPEGFEGHVYVVQQEEPNFTPPQEVDGLEAWSWDYYGGDSNTAKIMDVYGMVADQFASYGS